MRELLIAAAALAAAAPAPAQSTGPATTPDYAKDSSWLCLPGRKDSCSTPLPTTALTSAGYGPTSVAAPAKDPPVDCFFVYDTVSNDAGMNSDLNVGREEKLATEAQFGRFASACRPFVPVYRQMTLTAIAAYSAGVDVTEAAELAYRDVAGAWRNYLRNRNDGRPFVLVAQRVATGASHAAIGKLNELPTPHAARPQLPVGHSSD